MQDDQDVRRILIIGKTGSGKSTLAKELSRKLSIPHVEIDALFWKPGWQTISSDQLRESLDRALPANGAWLADGNYLKTSDMTWPRAQLIIWLDYPLLFVLWRLLWRTIWRMWTRERICNGNVENGRALFGLTHDDNIILECLRQRKALARELPRLIKEYGEGKVLRFMDERQCLAWLETVQEEKHAVNGDLSIY